MRKENTDLDRAVEEEPLRQQPAGCKQHLEVAEVTLDRIDDVRELDLDGHFLRAAGRRRGRSEYGRVNLPYGCGGEWQPVK